MTVLQLALLLLAAGCMLLAAAVLRLSARLRATSAAAERELAELRGELSGLQAGRGELERLSATDPVTGVWNHRRFQDALARELERARHAGRPLAVLMCDVDGFREVNAAFGHQTGSTVLRELAQRLSLEIRSVDTFARYGGEEFAVLLPDTGADGAAAVAERLCYAARKLVLSPLLEPGPPQLTVSIGAALFPQSGDHAATLLRAADAALAEAKQAGGDSWVLPTQLAN